MKSKILLLSFSITFLSILLFSSAKPAEAYEYIAPGQNFNEFEQKFYQAVEDPNMNFESYFGVALTNMLMWTTQSIAGQAKLTQTPNGPKYVREGGAIGLLADINGSFFQTPPASSIDYLAYLSSNMGFPRAYAQQGHGFQAFAPVLNLWRVFRDLAYLFLVIALVIIGLMIMFRRRIDPQTVISIQDAIPRIIITLILITFSYAIAGLLIDLTQLSTRVVAKTFQDQGLIARFRADDPSRGFPDEQSKLNHLLEADIFHLVNPLRDIAGLFGAFTNTAFTIEAKTLAALAGLTVMAVFAILGFFVMFQIFFALISPYVSIVFSIIFAPLQLLIGVLPGSQGSLTSWIKNLLANAAVFPVVFIMLIIAAVFKSNAKICEPFGGWQIFRNMPILGPADWATKCDPVAIDLWVAPGIGRWGELVGDLIAFGILFAVPKAADLVKNALKVQPGILSGIAGQQMEAGIKRIPLVGSVLPK